MRTFDPRSTILAIKQSLGTEAETAPTLTWDSIMGLNGMNETGRDVLVSMLQESGTDRAATVDLPTALGVIAMKGDSKPHSDLIVFIHNPQLVWETDKKVVQGVINLRNDYRAYGNMLVLLIGMGDTLPIENQQDVMVLEESLANP